MKDALKSYKDAHDTLRDILEKRILNGEFTVSSHDKFTINTVFTDEDTSLYISWWIANDGYGFRAYDGSDVMIEGFPRDSVDGYEAGGSYSRNNALIDALKNAIKQ